MRKVIVFILFVFSIVNDIYSLDLSKLKYGEKDRDYLKKYYTKGSCDIDQTLFIKDEIKKLKNMNLKDDELLEIFSNTDLLTGTRVAALRIYVKRNGKEILPKLEQMLLYYEELSYKSPASIPTHPNHIIKKHLQRCITEILIRDMKCKDKIEFIYKNMGDEKIDKTIFPAILRKCSEDREFDEIILEKFKKLSVKAKERLIIDLSIAKLKVIEQIIDTIDESDDSEIIKAKLSACRYYYDNLCLKRLNEWKSRFKDSKEIVYLIDYLINSINDGVNLSKDWLYQNPYDYED